MDKQVQLLLERLKTLYQNAPRDRRVLIAISGAPGSGKTTLAGKLIDVVNTVDLGSISDTSAMLLSLDGYHLPRAALDRLSDPIIAHARRGAAFTFDAASFLQVVKRLREPINAETKTITAPSFDHATKDPVLDDVGIPPECRIVILEGNYLSLGSGAREWQQAAGLMDELWFVEVPEDIARRRLLKRHIAAGISTTEEEALKRIEENDLINGREIVEGRLPVHVIVQGS